MTIPSTQKEVEQQTAQHKLAPGSYSDAEHIIEQQNRNLQSLFLFLKPLRPLLGWGLFLGIILGAGGDLLTKKLPEPEDFTLGYYLLAFLFLAIKDIGIGLIVSAVAVFGYEYGQHIRGDFERQLKQDGAFRSLDSAITLINDTNDTKSFIEVMKEDLTMIRSKETETALERVLNLSIGNLPDEVEFKELIKKLVQQAATLKATGTIYSESYLRFINWLCEHFIYHHATRLSHLEEHANNLAEATSWRFYLPTNKSVAGRMLGFQLACLKKKDLYQTISNVLFWEGKDFDIFWRETIKSCAEGVRSERLFNLSNLIRNEQLLEEKFLKCKEIMEKHKQLAETNKDMYEIRFFTLKQGEKILSDHKESAELVSGKIMMETMSLTSFGVFTHRTDFSDDVVSFRVDNEQVSQMTISRIEDDVYKYSTRFKMMWENCENVPNPFDNDIDYFKKVVQQEF